jgi:hypothetical protein
MEIRAMQLQDMEVQKAADEQKRLVLLKQKEEQEKMLQEIADKKVKRIKELAKTFVDPNNLEAEIESALNQLISYDFSMDTKGNIYKLHDIEKNKQLADTNP